MKKRKILSAIGTVIFTIISVFYVMPAFEVVMNSFKSNAYVNTNTFDLPNELSFVGFDNYVKGFTFGNYLFLKLVMYSIIITIGSVLLILLCTSMAAWYVARVGSQ